MTRETILTIAVLLAVFGSQAKSATVKYFADPEAMVARYAVKATPAKTVEPTGRAYYWRYDVSGISFGREGIEQCYDKLMGGVSCDQEADALFAPYDRPLFDLGPATPVWPCLCGGGSYAPVDPVTPPPVPLPPALALLAAPLAAIALMRKSK